MYLARKSVSGVTHYCLRASRGDGGRYVSRELFDLGQDPGKFIVYPGGNAFYFDQDLVDALAEEGVADLDRELETVLFPFLNPEIRRVVMQNTRPRPRRKKKMTPEERDRALSGLHLFDRRRLYYLRFGRIDRLEVLMRPHKFYDTLAGKSRDETEYCFRKLEAPLRQRELKGYVYAALDLSRYFPGEFARIFPAGLDQETLDQAFLTEICRLNRDADFLDIADDRTPDAGRLSDYLVQYAVFWFDYEFVQRAPRQTLFEEFARSRAAAPPPVQAVGIERACRVFRLTRQEWIRMSRRELTRLYRKLAMECHPDQGGKQEAFVELRLAFDELVSGKK